ncbi:MAG: endonuclease/exonuclease/phosphatase family protein [Myxococcales bacterium]|nr:endonuclease/exonuclease/phosphatase family protein [Myxococcales bacterium]
MSVVAKSRARKRSRVRAQRPLHAKPHLVLLRAPRHPRNPRPLGGEFSVATYNVHRWTGLNGRSRPEPARACQVIAELGADLIALQEVLRPFSGEDPLVELADALGLHVTFAATRTHRRGQIGNAILSSWPIAGVNMLDLSFSRVESRVAVAAQLSGGSVGLDVVATHLALAARTRHRQVKSLLEHPRLSEMPTLLMGDMNSWRRCKATRKLDEELASESGLRWPPSFPSTSPVLALDRVYARGLRILAVETHASAQARRASDHLPVVARVRL